MEVDYSNRRDWTQRYVQRKAKGKVGWADEDSYKAKEERIDSFLNRNPLPKNSRFLELGCGAGNITLFMAKKGFDAYGIDIEPVAIEWAKERMKASGVTANFSVRNVVDLKNLPDEFFDFVYDGETLHCIIGQARKGCLSNVFRVLKKGGHLLAGANLVNGEISEPVDLGSRCRFNPKSQCLYHGDIPYYYLSREKEFLDEIWGAGFRILHTEKTPKTPEYGKIHAGWLWVDAVKPKEISDG